MFCFLCFRRFYLRDLKENGDDLDMNNEDEERDDILFVLAAKYGHLLDIKWDRIDWMMTYKQWIQNASCIPKEWHQIRQNEINILHEITFWIDTTSLYAWHCSWYVFSHQIMVRIITFFYSLNDQNRCIILSVSGGFELFPTQNTSLSYNGCIPTKCSQRRFDQYNTV